MKLYIGEAALKKHKKAIDLKHISGRLIELPGYVSWYAITLNAELQRT